VLVLFYLLKLITERQRGKSGPPFDGEN